MAERHACAFSVSLFCRFHKEIPQHRHQPVGFIQPADICFVSHRAGHRLPRLSAPDEAIVFKQPYAQDIAEPPAVFFPAHSRDEPPIPPHLHSPPGECRQSWHGTSRILRHQGKGRLAGDMPGDSIFPMDSDLDMQNQMIASFGGFSSMDMGLPDQLSVFVIRIPSLHIAPIILRW